MKKKKCIAMLLAGGQGSRLGSLTSSIAKPAVSFGGKYRIIDFSLSNCVNSGIDTVGILVQYKPLILNRYVGTGESWDLAVNDGGVHILPPYAGETGGEWYEGTADAIYHNIDFIDLHNPDNVLILSGDHIYKTDYTKMMAVHEENKADLTVSVIEVPIEEAKAFLDDKGVKYIEKTGSNADEIVSAADALVAEGVQAVFTPTDNTVQGVELAIYEKFAEAGIAHYAGADSFALNGAFTGYGVDYTVLGKATADMVIDILVNGADPAEMAVQTFDNGVATVNTETAEALGFDMETVRTAFSAYCTEIVETTTSEEFD